MPQKIRRYFNNITHYWMRYDPQRKMYIQEHQILIAEAEIQAEENHPTADQAEDIKLFSLILIFILKL